MRIALSVVSLTYRQLTEMCVCIRETIRRVLNLPPTTIMEYKSNNGTAATRVLLCAVANFACAFADSMQDKSSFRVNPSDRTPLS